MLAAVGRGEIFSGDVVRAVHPDFKEERKAGRRPRQGRERLVRPEQGRQPRVQSAGRGADATTLDPDSRLRGDLPVRFAPNGGAVPGDRIVGILTPGEGITIYPIHSPALTAFDDQPERWLDVRWDIDSARKELYPTQIVVTAINEPGALGIVATTIGETGGNIDNIVFVPLATGFSRHAASISKSGI